MDDKRYFTVEEANALVPTLESRFAKVMRLRAQMRTAYEPLEGLGEPLENLTSSDGPPEVVRARGRFRGLMETLAEELSAIEALGVSVKDLDIGLCDFLGKVAGREVWLCWQYGEKEVAFWHDLDAGFSGRQPLRPARPSGRVLH